MSDCVLCGWTFDLLGKPIYAYRGPETLPLVWDTAGPRTVRMSESMGATIKGIATVAHWAQAHPEQLELAVGVPIELDGFPRLKVWGSMAPPGRLHRAEPRACARAVCGSSAHWSGDAGTASRVVRCR